MARLGFHPTRTTAPAPAVKPHQAPGELPLSICMIVKNEAENLPPLLASLAPLGAELIVVDTGSTDETVEIARAAGAKVFHSEWTGDFASARNVSLSHARRSWILWLDADDRIPPESIEPLRKLAAQRPVKAWSFVVKNTVDGGVTGTEFSQLRMFPNHPRLRFTGAVHEQVYPALVALGIPFEYLDVMVHHTGYTDPETVKRKQIRNREILRREIDRNGGSAMSWFQFGTTLAECDEDAEAEVCYRKSLDEIAKGDADVQLKGILPYLAAMLRVRKDDWKGARAILEELLDPDPSGWHPHQMTLVAETWLRTGSIEEAIGFYEKAYTPPQAKVLLPVDPKKASLQPLQNLAEYWKGVGNDALGLEFLRLLRSVIDNRFPPRRALPDAYLRYGQPARAAELFAWCIDKDGEDPGVWAGLVRATAMSGNPESAAGFLDAGLSRWPADPELRRLAQGG